MHANNQHSESIPSPNSSPNHHHHHHHHHTASTTTRANMLTTHNHHHHYHHNHNQQQISPLTNTFQACHLHIQRLLTVLQPSIESEEKRSFVFNAISNLLSELGLKTFLYGSVAFKTYLPDGDIDISVFESNSINLLNNYNPHSNGHMMTNMMNTVAMMSTANTTVSTSMNTTNAALTLSQISDQNSNQQQQQQYQPWYTKVRNAFKNVQESGNNTLVIRDVYFINAEVKLIKCVVNNIPIDMSSNQAGGLSTLCFLQEVDQLIGQDHLFKRSIILMKAWCYYESRILGSHHGLLSTYALTILIMYIFNVCYDDIDSPLRALYYVLQYFCQFDWENYAISIYGPVQLQSLPHIQVSDATFGAGEFFMNGRKRMTKHFFSNDFLAECVEKYARFDSVSSHTQRVFMPKFMNIIDPLREYNNLGRSVSKNNHLRIRRAFKKGAKVLKGILYGNVNQSRRILTVFFSNTSSHFDAFQNEEELLRYGSESTSPVSSPSNFHGGNERPRSSSLAQSSKRSPMLDSVASPPSPNWVRSNKVFDSKLEDCRANLLSATTHNLFGSNEGQSGYEESGSILQQHPTRTVTDDHDKTKEIPSRSKGKRKSKSVNPRGSHTNTVVTPAKEPASVESTPEKARKAISGPSPSPNSSDRSRNNKQKKASSKSRKYRANTLSDYINLENVSTTKTRQQKSKSAKKKPNSSVAE